MVRISAETKYNLMGAVERCSNYYKNTTHTYNFKEIYRDTDNTFSFTLREFLIKISGVS